MNMWCFVAVYFWLGLFTICSTYFEGGQALTERPNHHRPSQGFQYFVKFPGRQKNDISSRANTYVKSVVDKVNADDTYTNAMHHSDGYITEMPTKQSCNETKDDVTANLNSPYATKMKTFPFSEYLKRSTNGNIPYKELYPNHEMSYPSTDSKVPYSNPTVSATEQDEVYDNTITKESIENEAIIQDLNEITQEGSQNKDLENVDVETVSMVRFTGSVFTEEGLPALGHREFPVDYHFFYNIEGYPVLGHEEKRLDDRVEGRYWSELADGRVMEVSYTADEDGYRPTTTYRSGDTNPRKHQE